MRLLLFILLLVVQLLVPLRREILPLLNLRLLPVPLAVVRLSKFRGKNRLMILKLLNTRVSMVPQILLRFVFSPRLFRFNLPGRISCLILTFLFQTFWRSGLTGQIIWFSFMLLLTD